MSSNRRRSDRLMLTIPLRIRGTDAAGARFNAEARTVTINRHGARVQTPQALSGVSQVRITNQISRREADFRVVGLVAPMSAQGADWGVECVDDKDNIWAIQFPPMEQGQNAESKALVECHKCHTVALMPLSLVEVEVLETSGILSKPCSSCQVISPWSYTETQVAMGAPPDEQAAGAEAAAAPSRDTRRHRRVSLQLPVQVRDYYGDVEHTKSENVSKGGFCFGSEKDFLLGQGIMVVCPYNAGGPNIEVQARIVRKQDVEGSHRKVYGVRYISAPA